MKWITLLLLTSSTSWSLPNLKCITSGFPTTSFLVSDNGPIVEVRVVNHNGLKYAPLYNGLMTLNDIDYLKRTAEFFSKIGDDFTVSFKKEKCKFVENKFYSCSKPEKFEIGSVTADAVYFSTTETVDKIPDFEFTKTNAKISFRKNNEDYNLEMSYYYNGCELTGLEPKN